MPSSRSYPWSRWARYPPLCGAGRKNHPSAGVNSFWMCFFSQIAAAAHQITIELSFCSAHNGHPCCHRRLHCRVMSGITTRNVPCDLPFRRASRRPARPAAPHRLIPMLTLLGLTRHFIRLCGSKTTRCFSRFPQLHPHTFPPAAPSDWQLSHRAA